MEYEKENDSDDELFNEDWMVEIERETEDCKKFFYTNTENIAINIFYINRKNELFSNKSISYDMNNNIITKDELIGIIKKNMNHEKKKYRLLSMLSYNFDFDNDDINKYFKNMKNYQILKVHKNLDDIKWNKSINFFKDLNEIYLFFIEKRDIKHNKTKRIFIKSRLKKTKRKRLK